MNTPPPPAVPAAAPDDPGVKRRVLRRRLTQMPETMLRVLGAYFGPPPTPKEITP